MSFSGTEQVTLNGYTFAINDSDVNNFALGYQYKNCNYLIGNLHEANTFQTRPASIVDVKSKPIPKP